VEVENFSTSWNKYQFLKEDFVIYAEVIFYQVLLLTEIILHYVCFHSLRHLFFVAISMSVAVTLDRYHSSLEFENWQEETPEDIRGLESPSKIKGR
jgi:hypothetical protein